MEEVPWAAILDRAPRDLIAPELFGHERGAFTGALHGIQAQGRTPGPDWAGPLSWGYANQTQLLKDNYVLGHIGVTLDLSKLLAHNKL